MQLHVDRSKQCSMLTAKTIKWLDRGRVWPLCVCEQELLFVWGSTNIGRGCGLSIKEEERGRIFSSCLSSGAAFCGCQVGVSEFGLPHSLLPSSSIHLPFTVLCSNLESGRSDGRRRK